VHGQQNYVTDNPPPVKSNDSPHSHSSDEFSAHIRNTFSQSFRRLRKYSFGVQKRPPHLTYLTYLTHLTLVAAPPRCVYRRPPVRKLSGSVVPKLFLCPPLVSAIRFCVITPRLCQIE